MQTATVGASNRAGATMDGDRAREWRAVPAGADLYEGEVRLGQVYRTGRTGTWHYQSHAGDVGAIYGTIDEAKAALLNSVRAAAVR